MKVTLEDVKRAAEDLQPDRRMAPYSPQEGDAISWVDTERVKYDLETSRLTAHFAATYAAYMAQKAEEA